MAIVAATAKCAKIRAQRIHLFSRWKKLACISWRSKYSTHTHLLVHIILVKGSYIHARVHIHTMQCTTCNSMKCAKKYIFLSILIFLYKNIPFWDHSHFHVLLMFLLRLSKNMDRITMDTLRPLPIFFGITSTSTGPSFCLAPDAFTPPSKHMRIDKHTAEKVKQRVDLNFAYFMTNYALIAAGTTVVVILMHPKMIIYSAVVLSLWKIHNVVVEHNIPLVVMGNDVGRYPYLTVEVRTKLLYGITLWVVVVYCLRPFLLATGLTTLMVAAHAMMRDPKQLEGTRYTSITSSSSSAAAAVSSYKDIDSDDSSGSEVIVEKIDSV